MGVFFFLFGVARMECFFECCLEIIADMIQTGIENEMNKQADKHFEKGLEGADEYEPAVSWLKKHFPESDLKFPLFDDLGVAHGSKLDVFYIILPDGIHRVTLNRIPSSILPSYCIVNGTVLFSKSGK